MQVNFKEVSAMTQNNGNSSSGSSTSSLQRIPGEERLMVTYILFEYYKNKISQF